MIKKVLVICVGVCLGVIVLGIKVQLFLYVCYGAPFTKLPFYSILKCCCYIKNLVLWMNKYAVPSVWSALQLSSVLRTFSLITFDAAREIFLHVCKGNIIQNWCFNGHVWTSHTLFWPNLFNGRRSREQLFFPLNKCRFPSSGNVTLE